MSGILIYACASPDDADHCDPGSLGLAWHTAVDDLAAPMAVLPSLLPANAGAPALNPSGDLQYPLAPGKHLFTLLWEPGPFPFPPLLGVNLFFNGNALEPGITATVPTWVRLTLTNFRTNLAPATYSLYIREVESPATLSYSDGTNSVELSVLTASPPTEVADVDRMRMDGFGRDGHLDAVGILEITVTPAQSAQPPVSAAAPGATVAGPMHAEVGEPNTLASGQVPPTPPIGTSPSPGETAPAEETASPPTRSTATWTAGLTPQRSKTAAAAATSPVPLRSPSPMASSARRTPTP